MTISRPAPMRGLYDDQFWAFLQHGEYRLQKCGKCETYRYPPAACCPKCNSERAEWTLVEGTGEIVSWTRFHRQYFEGMPPPYIVVSVALAEGPMVIGNLFDLNANDPQIGALVHLRIDMVKIGGAPHPLPQWCLQTTSPVTPENQTEE